MKVQALFHVRQTVGSLSVERVKDTVFELPNDDAVAAIAQGIVRPVDPVPEVPANAKNRKTKALNEIETK